MSFKRIIEAQNIAKCFHIYEKPHYRLLQILFGKYKQFYTEFWALKELSLSIKPGEAVGIIGLNGSGKSTLLQIICGTLHPTKGLVKVRGRVAALLELGSGFNVELTGRENIFLYAALFGLTQKEITDRFSKIELFADIGDFIEQPIKTYSTGMHVRLAFAVIANIDADLLVIDEALSVGDAFFQQKCIRFLREFMAKGTLIFVSHDHGAVINLCSRALWLDKGNLIMDGLPRDVTDAYLANLYEMQQGKSAIEFRKMDIDSADISEPEINEDEIPIKSSLRLENVEPSFLKISQLDSNYPQTIFDLSQDLPGFGKGDAIIKQVTLVDENNHILHQIYGGEMTTLNINVLIKNLVERPIVGFQIKDKLGQVVFGNNTYNRYKKSNIIFQPDTVVTSSFSFIMPTLKAGNYSVQVAIASGTQDNHVQLHWVYDALIFEVLPRQINQLYFDGFIHIPIIRMEFKNHVTSATN